MTSDEGNDERRLSFEHLSFFVIRNSDFVVFRRMFYEVKLTEIPAANFDLAMTLNSGQVFHWEKVGNGFLGAIGERPIYVEQRGEILRAKVASASLRAGALYEPEASRWTNQNMGRMPMPHNRR
jgi:hypothetical protein